MLQKKPEGFNRNIVQKPLYISISEYIKIVKEKYDYGNILLEIYYKQHSSRGCPLCGKKNCLRYLCDYKRNLCYINDSGSYDNVKIWIVRFICSTKERSKRNGGMLTVSLIPTDIVPYKKPSVTFQAKIIKEHLIENKDLVDMEEDINLENKSTGENNFKEKTVEDEDQPEDIILSAVLIKRICKDFLIALNRYQVIYPNIKYNNFEPVKQIEEFINYLKDYNTDNSKGISGAIFDFYLDSGNYKKGGLFLFGTPYQDRRRR